MSTVSNKKTIAKVLNAAKHVAESVYNVHVKRVHADSARQFSCGKCTAAFPIPGRVPEKIERNLCLKRMWKGARLLGLPRIGGNASNVNNAVPPSQNTHVRPRPECSRADEAPQV